MNKTIIASLAAAFAIATFITFAPGLTGAVEAGTPVSASKADRLDARPIGKSCSERAWPYFEADCLRGQSLKAQPVSVRIVTADRLGK